MSYIGRKRADFPYLKDSPPSLGADTRSVAPHPLLDFFRPFICPPSPSLIRASSKACRYFHARWISLPRSLASRTKEEGSGAEGSFRDSTL